MQPLKNNILRLLSPTGNMFEPTIKLLNIEPSPIDIYADYIADLESHRRLDGLAFLRVERIAYCICSASHNHVKDALAAVEPGWKDCPHGPGALYVEVRDINNFEYTAVLRVERKTDSALRLQRRRSSFNAQTLGLGLQRRRTSTSAVHTAPPSNVISENGTNTSSGGTGVGGDTDLTYPPSPCVLPHCPTSPTERKNHVPHVHFGTPRKPNPDDIIFTDSWPTPLRDIVTHTLEISTLHPKNLPFFQFLAMVKAVSASAIHPSHAFTLAQVEAECIVSDHYSKSRISDVGAVKGVQEVIPPMTDQQMCAARSEYRDCYNEFKVVVNFLKDKADSGGHNAGCRRMSPEERKKRMDSALQEVETNFNLNLPF